MLYNGDNEGNGDSYGDGDDSSDGDRRWNYWDK